MNKYYITTSIAYASSKPHVGNTYEVVLADAIARYKRLKGYDVYFQTGTDEHGQKIDKKALDAGLEPQKYVDNMSSVVEKICKKMNINYDKFVRTSDNNHKTIVSKIFKKLYENGDIYKGKYEGWYCSACEAFIAEGQLNEGKCPECGKDAEKTCEEAYFLKLSKYKDKLLEYINDNPDFLLPELRKNEMINNFFNQGLQDLCVSRSSFKWGIPVSFDEEYIIYVWIDALSNYITFLGYNPDGESSKEYKKYWPADLHLIGKDIFRFHAIYWPIMLMALDQPLPKTIFGHPWLLTNNDKMSKSKGNVIYADELVDLFGLDEIRYYMLHEMPYANDGNLSYELLIERINSDLVNTLGNLVNRTIAMSHKYFDGLVIKSNSLLDIDLKLIENCKNIVKSINLSMEKIDVNSSLESIIELARKCNKYIDENEPWELYKNIEDKERLNVVIYNLLECIRYIAVLLQPFLPDTSEKIFYQLNTNLKDFDSLKTFGLLESNTKLNINTPLFLRINKEEMLEKLSKM